MSELAAEGAASGEPLVKVTLVPVEVFGTECDVCDKDVGYGLMDAVGACSDCNRAEGHIYRRDEGDLVSYLKPDDVITIYVPQSEMWKFDKRYSADD